MVTEYDGYVKHFKVKDEETDKIIDVGIEAAKVTDTKEIEFGSGFNIIEDKDKVTVTANFMPADTEVVKVVVATTPPESTEPKTLYLLVD